MNRFPKHILKENQYPKYFITRITNFTLTKIVTAGTGPKHCNQGTAKPKFCIMMPVEYRGKVSEDFAKKTEQVAARLTLLFHFNQNEEQNVSSEIPDP